MGDEEKDKDLGEKVKELLGQEKKAEEAPPPLGVHVSETLGAKTKMGGG